MDLLARNQLVVVNPFLQKRESNKINYKSGNNRTEIDLLIVRSCQRNKVRDCKVLAGEHITSQYKPLVYEMWIRRDKQRRRKQRQALLEQLRRYVAEHQESPHKVERKKHSGGRTGKLKKQYKRRSH